MTPNLSEPLERLLRPLFALLPPEQAMRDLVVADGKPCPHAAKIEKVLAHPELQRRPALAAGIWLYFDQLERSHTISQGMANATGSFWHGIMHRREGDFSNSHYWFRKTGRHPAMNKIDLAGGGAGSGTEIAHYDPHAFIDRVEEAHRKGHAAPDLVALQRHEWTALFEWCARR